MKGIVMKNCKNAKVIGNEFSGLSVAIEAIDSEDIEMIDNIILESPLEDPKAFVEFVNQTPKLQREISKAEKGNKKSIVFLKAILEKITVETVMIAFKSYLMAKGIEI